MTTGSLDGHLDARSRRDDGRMTKPYLNFDHFRAYSQNIALGQDYTRGDFVYMAYYDVILAANTSIKGYVANEANLSDSEKGLLGAAYAFRGLSYLELASMFEFLPNEIFPDGRNAQGNVVTNLTVPIVTDKLSQQEAYNNPRATHKQMFDFILSDLDKAEANIGKLATNTKDVPHLDVVYGLKARLYLWDGQYEKAAEYARKAIEAHSGAPLTAAQWMILSLVFPTLPITVAGCSRLLSTRKLLAIVTISPTGRAGCRLKHNTDMLVALESLYA